MEELLLPLFFAHGGAEGGECCWKFKSSAFPVALGRGNSDFLVFSPSAGVPRAVALVVAACRDWEC